jgi:hypothetical protein
MRVVALCYRKTWFGECSKDDWTDVWKLFGVRGGMDAGELN